MLEPEELSAYYAPSSLLLLASSILALVGIEGCYYTATAYWPLRKSTVHKIVLQKFMHVYNVTSMQYLHIAVYTMQQEDIKIISYRYFQTK